MKDHTISIDAEQIASELKFLVVPDSTVEMRVLYENGPAHVQHYASDDLVTMAQDALRFGKTAKGVYWLMNPLPSDWRGSTATDADIVRRVWLLVDFDPKRKGTSSATDDEKEAARQKMVEVDHFLSDRGWSLPIIADSGNGWHLLFRIDLPTDDKGLVVKVLHALARRFDDKSVSVDTRVGNASRICKLYGTVSRKGEDTPDRPHRISEIWKVPERLECVTIAQMQSLIDESGASGPADSQPDAPCPHPVTMDRESFPQAIQMAQNYLAKMDPSIEGERGHDRLLKAASVLVNDYRLEDSEAFDLLLSDFNPRCEPLWTEHDIRRKIDEAKKNPPNRPRKGLGTGKSFEFPNRNDPSRPQNVNTTTVILDEQWPDPEPLPDDLARVIPFDYEMLPSPFRQWNMDIAARMQCPPDFPAVSTMIVTASLAAGKVCIRPKRHDDWQVTANLYGVVVGRPGIMKTPAIMEPIQVLKRLELDARKRFELDNSDAVTKDLLGKIKVENAKRAASKAKSDDEAIQVLQDALGFAPPLPVRKRYIVNDSTVEKLGVILNENPTGVLVFRDELKGFLASLEKENQQHARAFYLEAWNGNSSFTYDRIERGTLDIDIAIVNLLGGIQPGPLQEYFRTTMRGGSGDDGMLQRFQLAVWPDVQGDWTNVDRWPDTPAKQAALNVFQRLDALDPSVIGAEPDEDGKKWFLRFSPAAQDRFDQWREILEKRLRSGDEPPYLESHLSKYRSLVPSLALLIHLCEVGHGAVSDGSTAIAIRWADYLETHARRIYGNAMQADVSAAKVILRKLTKAELQNGFTLRDIYRKHWSGLSDKEAAQAAVDVLVEFHHLRGVSAKTGGRGSTTYWSNPRTASTS